MALISGQNRLVAPTAGVNSALANALKDNVALRQATIASASIAAAAFAGLGSASIRPHLPASARLAATTAGVNSALANALKDNVALLQATITSAAFGGLQSAHIQSEKPDDADVSLSEPSAAANERRGPNALSSPDAVAAVLAMIVCLLIIGLWLREANRLGDSPDSINLFGLLGDLDNLARWTAATWVGSFAILRRLRL